MSKCDYSTLLIIAPMKIYSILRRKRVNKSSSAQIMQRIYLQRLKCFCCYCWHFLISWLTIYLFIVTNFNILINSFLPQLNISLFVIEINLNYSVIFVLIKINAKSAVFRGNPVTGKSITTITHNGQQQKKCASIT